MLARSARSLPCPLPSTPHDGQWRTVRNFVLVIRLHRVRTLSSGLRAAAATLVRLARNRKRRRSLIRTLPTDKSRLHSSYATQETRASFSESLIASATSAIPWLWRDRGRRPPHELSNKPIRNRTAVGQIRAPNDRSTKTTTTPRPSARDIDLLCPRIVPNPDGTPTLVLNTAVVGSCCLPRGRVSDDSLEIGDT